MKFPEHYPILRVWDKDKVHIALRVPGKGRLSGHPYADVRLVIGNPAVHINQQGAGWSRQYMTGFFYLSRRFEE